MLDQKFLDYIIIGAGPAGLCFAGLLQKQLHTTNFRIYDMGKPVYERQHDDPQDIAVGAGGNGVFSDGKFSYFPAGTNVWKLCYSLIQKAHHELVGDLDKYHGTVPEVPTEEEVLEYFFELEHSWKLKKYPTVYIGLDERKQLIQYLVNKIPKENVFMEHEVVKIQKYNHFKTNIPIYEVESVDLKANQAHIVYAKNIIFAGGRFFPLRLPIEIPMVFRRYEFGVRLETHASNKVMIGLPEFEKIVDPKFRYKHDDSVEFRTFCWCRNGETVLSKLGDMETYSGRSDCVPTTSSNFGFLVRITDPSKLSRDDFQKISRTPPFDITLEEALQTPQLQAFYGEYVGGLLQTALKSITDEFPPLRTSEAHLLGPSIEGVGMYPDIDHNLRIKPTLKPALKPALKPTLKPALKTISNNPKDVQENIYCIGDCTGTFRGIIPCMIGGYYLAHALAFAKRNITFVSGNTNKIIETEQILGPLKTQKLDLPEFQGTPEEIAIQKCRLASEKVHGAVIVEDTSLCFNALGGMPGPYVKWFMQSCGCEGLVKMLEGFEDKTAYVKCVFAYSDGDGSKPNLFVGITEGTIVSPRGSLNFGWDPIFQPKGLSKTYGEIDDGAKNKFSHRYRAIMQLKDYLSALE